MGTYLNDSVGESRSCRMGGGNIAVLHRGPESPILKRGLYLDAKNLGLGVKQLIDDHLRPTMVKRSAGHDGCNHYELTFGLGIFDILNVPANAEHAHVGVHKA